MKNMKDIHIFVDQENGKIVGICVFQEGAIIKMCLDDDAKKLYDKIMEVLQ